MIFHFTQLACPFKSMYLSICLLHCSIIKIEGEEGEKEDDEEEEEEEEEKEEEEEEEEVKTRKKK